MSIGRLFQAAGPATLKARSVNFNDVRGTSKALLTAERRGQTLTHLQNCDSTANCITTENTVDYVSKAIFI